MRTEYDIANSNPRKNPYIIRYPVACPLMGTKIDMDTCFDIHMVVEGHAPNWTAPEQIFTVPNYESVCETCKYHRND